LEESVYTSGEIVWNTILIEHELQLAQSFPQLLFSDFFEGFSLWQGFVSLSLQQLSFTDFSLQHFSTFWANAICFGSIKTAKPNIIKKTLNDLAMFLQR